MTADMCSASKLTVLVTKLHEYLALSEEDCHVPPVPEISHGTINQDPVESHTVDQIIQKPGSLNETVKPASYRSKRKPSIVTKHTGLDESDASDERGDEDAISNNGLDSVFDVNSLPKGTVVVKPEPVGNEVKDDFRGPEFRCKGAAKFKTDFSRKRGGQHLQIVSCTACGQQVNHFQKDSFYQHPVLKVLICKPCFKYYMSDDISKDVDGMDEQCRWCAEGGNLICCDFCSNAFCKKCILRNLGRKELSGIMDEESKWYCYICSPEPLLDLVIACDAVLQNHEHLWHQQRKRAKAEHDKTGQDENAHKLLKKDKTTLIGKEHTLDSPVVFNSLRIPKELAKKGKKLVETTTALNNTFVKFIQQDSEDQGTNIVRLRHLKAFRSVLADLKTAHAVLEEALEQELKDMLQNGGENDCDIRLSQQGQDGEMFSDVPSTHVENQHNVKNSADDGRDSVEEYTAPKDVEMEESPSPLHKVQKLTGGIEAKTKKDNDNDTEGEVGSSSGRNSLGEIVIASHTVADEIFGMPHCIADSSGGTERSEYSPARARKTSSSKSLDSRKSPIMVTRKLVVKLTPMPLKQSLGFRSKEAQEENKDAEDKEEEKEDWAVGESEESVMLDDDQENRRSPRVKTTPLRRQADRKGKLSCSHNTKSDPLHDDSAKAETSRTMDEQSQKGKGVCSRMEDSDSDEVPAILLQTAAMTPSSGESESEGEDSPKSIKKKCLFGLKKIASQSPEKVVIAQRIKARPSERSCKKVLTRKAIQKSRRNGSNSSSDDSDLEREITNLSKIRAKKLRGDEDKKVEKLDAEDGEGQMCINKVTKENRKSTVKPLKRLLKEKRTEEQSSSSFTEEGQDVDSGDDSDDQKIKPITEKMTVLGASSFQQSSGEEGEMKPGPISADDDDDDPENRIAKKMLLAQIKANYSSGEDSSADEESEEEDKKKVKARNESKDEEEDEDLTWDSDISVKKTHRQHHLLRHKLSPCNGQPEGETATTKPKELVNGVTKKTGQHETLPLSTSSDDSAASDFEESGISVLLSDSEEGGNVCMSSKSSKKTAEENELRCQQKKWRHSAQESSSRGETSSNDEGEDKGEDDDENDPKGTPKGRKKIRNIIKDDHLRLETQNALKEEEARRKRITEREHLRENLREVIVVEDTSPVSCVITTKLVLEEIEETKEPLIQVHRNLVTKLKPHQVDGVQFMWECCCESLKKIEKSPGSGCILAHCMGLGKTLQVVAFLHTMLLCEKLKFKTALVVCPLNTALNWLNEFAKWQKGMKCVETLQVYELSTVKLAQLRIYILEQWHRVGGVMIIGYEMYRNLTQGRNINGTSFRKTLVEPGPDFVICDEGHILRNEASAISKAMSSIKTRRRVVLTGTPMQNNLNEYHCMVNFIKENLLGSITEFRNRFINPIQNGQSADSTPSDVRLMKKRAHILYEMLAGCVQRKDYSALTKFLPPKHEYVLAVRVTPIQVKLYRYYLEHFTGECNAGGRGRSGTKLFQDFQMLSRIWTHPWCLQLDYLKKENKGYFDEDILVESSPSEKEEMSMSSEDENEKGEKTRGKKLTSNNPDRDDSEVRKKWRSSSRGRNKERRKGASRADDVRVTSSSGAGSISPDWYKDFVTEEDAAVLQHSGKMVLLFEILSMAEEVGDKVLVFSQSLISLDLIEGFLAMADNAKKERKPSPYKGEGSWIRNLDYYRLDGSTNALTRNKWAERFNDNKRLRGRLFLISTRAGSLGINLVAANRVVVFDASWNPSYDIQSIFRVYRFGQLKTVFVYRFLAQGTMEEKIYDRQVTKQSLSFRVVDQQQIERHFTMNELTELYNFEPDLLDDPISEKRRKRATPMLPKDTFLAKLLHSFKDQIVGYHEHDSLLDHKEEEALSEEDRKAAWAELEAEKGLSLHVNKPSHSTISPGATQKHWIPQSIQQMEKLIKQGREKVRDATKALSTLERLTLQEHIQLVRKENPTMSKEQVYALALRRHHCTELELNRRKVNYQDVLSKQQMLIEHVQKVLNDTKVRKQQISIANQTSHMNQLATQKSTVVTCGTGQVKNLRLYQQLGGLAQALPRVRSPTTLMSGKPGPSTGN
ncbi:hypothetical protein AAFF_G00311820 [Aldrovandia affinis]|uniref:DNA helicase n=1 Tax=Aldrovandia affinis TaxID=143900 RepID=A0AAD7SNK8_9TELE|nr:hypothetical protein AAFF_G00311820 [Aldrovandia affinis]